MQPPTAHALRAPSARAFPVRAINMSLQYAYNYEHVSGAWGRQRNDSSSGALALSALEGRAFQGPVLFNRDARGLPWQSTCVRGNTRSRSGVLDYIIALDHHKARYVVN